MTQVMAATISPLKTSAIAGPGARCFGGREAVAALSGLLTGLVHPLPDRRFPHLLGAPVACGVDARVFLGCGR